MDQTEGESISERAIHVPDFSRMRAFLAVASDAPDTEADVFQSVEWFEHLAAHGFVDGVQPWLIGVAGTDPAARCVLPLARKPDRVSSLSNYYSSLYGVVGTTRVPLAAWRALARMLRCDPAGSVVNLQPLAEDASWAEALVAALRESGFWVGNFQCFGNWYLPVAHPTFDDYFAALPSALRHSIERGRRRLGRAGHALQIHVREEPGLQEAIDAFEAVYRQSWKQPEPCPQFMPGLMRLAAQKGWLRLGVLRVQGEPVAAQVWLVKDGKANIYKLAYMQGFERLSPGSVLTAALMAHVMDVDRVHEVDYLTGDDAYKRDWMSHRRVRIGLVAFDWRRPRGLAAGVKHFWGRAVRRLQAWLRRAA